MFFKKMPIEKAHYQSPWWHYPGERRLTLHMIMKIHKQSIFPANYANDFPNLLHPRIIKLRCWTVQIPALWPIPQALYWPKTLWRLCTQKSVGHCWVAHALLPNRRHSSTGCLLGARGKGWHWATWLLWVFLCGRCQGRQGVLLKEENEMASRHQPSSP